MSDPLIGAISAFMPNLMVVMAIFVPLVILGIIVLLFVVSRFQAWAEIEYGYESKNDLRNYKVKYNRDRSFLISAGIPFLDPKIGFPVPIAGDPIRARGKPCYRFYSPEPGIFIPVRLALDREILTGYERDAEGNLRKDKQKNAIPIYQRIGDLIPKVGFESRQAFAESFSEAEKLYQERNKLLALVAQWGPVIIFVVLMLVVIVMLGQLVANINAGVTVQCVTEAMTKAGGATEALAPWIK